MLRKGIALKIGGFVELPNDIGYGKLLAFQGDEAIVSTFYSSEKRETASFKRSQIKRAYIGPQTRVYVDVEGIMRPGRVVDFFLREDLFVEYEVRFPNSKSQPVSEEFLEVRCWAAAEDPERVLASGSAESQFLHDRRKAASDRLIGTLSATQGMTALLSSAIDIVPYQVAAIRRVLSDPLQRYLLADEVGMGKTIEAGVIIRQCLLDDPSRTVQILVPEALKHQWEEELSDRFRSKDFPDAIEVQPHCDFYVGSVPDLLVIDEAHLIIGNKTVQSLAHVSPRLLLLSATPVLGNELAFLSLLNLLDPVANRIEDIESFKQKVAQRQQIGRFVLGLQPTAPKFVLKQRLGEIESRCPGDSVALELARIAKVALDDGDSAKLHKPFRALQAHIADLYRIHQRVIRSRRSDVDQELFGDRRPIKRADGVPKAVRPTIEAFAPPLFLEMEAAIDHWRSESLLIVEGRPLDDETAISRWYFSLLEAAAISLKALRLRVNDSTADGFPAIQHLRNDLRGIAESATPEDCCNAEQIDFLRQVLLSMRQGLVHEIAFPKIVVFCSDPDTSEALLAVLNPKEAVVFDPASPARLAGFLSENKIWVLIADPTAEEGLNITNAHAILHADLPFSASRVEQRIGRLDRFGRKVSGIRQRVVLPTDDDGSVWEAWFDVLAHSFGVFTNSISNFQFILKPIEDGLATACYKSGSSGLKREALTIRDKLDVEQLKQNDQYVLDQIAIFDESNEHFVKELLAADSDEIGIEHSMEGWILEVMGINRRPANWPRLDPFLLEWSVKTRTPRVPWEAMFGLDLKRPLTWHRKVATADRAVSLLRQGTPLVDGCSKFMRWDDRGTAFATWRVQSGWGTIDDAWMGFRLCFVIEPGVPEAESFLNTADLNGIKRRAQRYLPAWTLTIHVSTLGNIVLPGPLLEALERPYTTQSTADDSFDINLSSRSKLLAQHIDAIDFKQLCSRTRQNAESYLRSSDEYGDKMRRARELLARDLARQTSNLERRLVLEPKARPSLEFDLEVNEVVKKSVLEPRIRLDAFGFFILSGESPSVANEA